MTRQQYAEDVKARRSHASAGGPSRQFTWRRHSTSPAGRGIGSSKPGGSIPPNHLSAAGGSARRTSGCKSGNARSAISKRRMPSQKPCASSPTARTQAAVGPRTSVRRLGHAEGPRLPVSRRKCCAWVERAPRRKAPGRPQHRNRIQASGAQSRRRYGSPKIPAQRRCDGDRVGTPTVAQWPPPHGIRSRGSRRDQAPTHSRHRFPVADNGLARRLSPAGRTRSGGPISRRFQRRKIVRWAAGSRMTPDLVRTARDQAVQRDRPPAGVVHHSDRGRHCAARDCPARLARYQRRGSRSQQGHGWGHTCLELWHRRLKKALVNLRHFRIRATARTARFAYLAVFDHRQRLHRARGYRRRRRSKPSAPPRCGPVRGI